MLVRKAFKFRLNPTPQQKVLLNQFAGTTRYVYNKGLALQKELREAEEKHLSYAGLCLKLTEWRHDPLTPWLKEASVEIQQQALRDLTRAYRNFFDKRASFPKFKKRTHSKSFRFPSAQRFSIDQKNNRLRLPKIGWIKYRNSRAITGTIKNITISFKAGHWYYSAQTEEEKTIPLPTVTSSVGIDLGVANLATLSNGIRIAPLDSYKKHQARLQKAQQALSRKKKFSSNWYKQLRTVQKLHARIANARLDYLHKLTTIISKNHAMIVIEDLQVANMSKSAKGTTEVPGRNVKAKSGLNKSILDQAWNELRRQLTYKTDWNGARLITVPAPYTSQTCSNCNHTNAANRPTQAHFACTNCGYAEHADINAAQNILRAGHAQIACQVNREPILSATGTHPSNQQTVAAGIPAL